MGWPYILYDWQSEQNLVANNHVQTASSRLEKKSLFNETTKITRMLVPDLPIKPGWVQGGGMSLVGH